MRENKNYKTQLSGQEESRFSWYRAITFVLGVVLFIQLMFFFNLGIKTVLGEDLAAKVRGIFVGSPVEDRESYALSPALQSHSNVSPVVLAEEQGQPPAALQAPTPVQTVCDCSSLDVDVDVLKILRKDKIESKHISSGAVGKKQIKRRGIHSRNIHSNAVNSRIIEDGSVDSEDLDDSLTIKALRVERNLVVSGTISGNISGNLVPSSDIDLNSNLILNIGNTGTDFTQGGGLNLAGNLAVGNANPQALVHVGSTGTPGSIDGTDDLYVYDDLEVDGVIYGTISGAYSPSGDLDMNTNIITNIGHADTDFTSGGGLNIAGSVGIGTTGPGALLDIKSNNSGDIIFELENYNGVKAFSIDSATLKAKFYGSGTLNSPQISFYGNTNTGLAAQVGVGVALLSNDNKALFADTSGNVGIGTTGPGAKLEVAGSVGIGAQVSNTHTLSVLGNARVGDGTTMFSVEPATGYFELTTAGTKDSYFNTALWSNYFTQTGYSTDNYGYLRVLTAGAPGDLVLNPSGGNIGIGTTSPDTKLHIVDGNGTVQATGGAQLIVQNNDDASDDAIMSLLAGVSGLSKINFGDSNDVDVGRLWYDHSDNYFHFGYGSEEQVSIDIVTGNVGIGTTGPSSKLEIAGSLKFSGASEYYIEPDDDTDVLKIGDSGNYLGIEPNRNAAISLYTFGYTQPIRIHAGGVFIGDLNSYADIAAS